MDPSRRMGIVRVVIATTKKVHSRKPQRTTVVLWTERHHRYHRQHQSDVKWNAGFLDPRLRMDTAPTAGERSISKRIQNQQYR